MIVKPQACQLSWISQECPGFGVLVQVSRPKNHSPGIEAAHVSLTVFSPVSGKSHTCTIEHPQNGTNAQRFDVM